MVMTCDKSKWFYHIEGDKNNINYMKQLNMLNEILQLAYLSAKKLLTKFIRRTFKTSLMRGYHFADIMK